jgi:hypothetical protein
LAYVIDLEYDIIYNNMLIYDWYRFLSYMNNDGI